MNLLNFLKKNENARKIFGARELTIIEKQLTGINLTQSEKNRLSRDIRKKLDFMKEASQFANEFPLKKGAVIKELIDEAKQEILNDELHQKIVKILLFGSTVDLERSFRSDIDIAVVFSDITPKEAFNFRIRISGRVSDDVDIQVFNVLPGKIKKSIIKSHKVLYKNGKN